MEEWWQAFYCIDTTHKLNMRTQRPRTFTAYTLPDQLVYMVFQLQSVCVCVRRMALYPHLFCHHYGCICEACKHTPVQYFGLGNSAEPRECLCVQCALQNFPTKSSSTTHIYGSIYIPYNGLVMLYAHFTARCLVLSNNPLTDWLRTRTTHIHHWRADVIVVVVVVLRRFAQRPL